MKHTVRVITKDTREVITAGVPHCVLSQNGSIFLLNATGDYANVTDRVWVDYSIGQQDIHGKEVYENDIVIATVAIRMLQEWESHVETHGIITYNPEFAAYDLNIIGRKVPEIGTVGRWKVSQVVGNAHQHLQLVHRIQVESGQIKEDTNITST